MAHYIQINEVWNFNEWETFSICFIKRLKEERKENGAGKNQAIKLYDLYITNYLCLQIYFQKKETFQLQPIEKQQMIFAIRLLFSSFYFYRVNFWYVYEG